MKPPFLGPRYGLVFFLFISIFCFRTSFAQPQSQTFNSSGTYTIPANYAANVTIEAWGGGGGGGTNIGGARGGGGGGAYASVTTMLGAGSYTVTVGTGGGPGVNGTASSFTTLVIAAGGSASPGFTGGAGGTIAASTGSILIAGINGSGASGNNGGGGGNGGNGGTGAAGGLANNGSAGAPTIPAGGGGGKAGPGGGGLSTNGADGVVIVTVNVVLPVKFSSIRAIEKQLGVELQWTSYDELNLDKYEVEHSVDGRSFTPIGWVEAHNSISSVQYRYLDVNPGGQVNFYRLRVLDLDGRASYSSVVKINLDKTSGEISVYPNPVTGGYVSFQSAYFQKGIYNVSIYQVTGQALMSETFEHPGGAINQTLRLPESVRPGTYSMRVTNNNMELLNRIFLVK